MFPASKEMERQDSGLFRGHKQQHQPVLDKTGLELELDQTS